MTRPASVNDNPTPLPRQGAIGVFDSGYGGLTVLDALRRKLPDYDYIYLGDNARAPYGPRTFDVVYDFTLQAVNRLFDLGCPLVILACNTASAKALRTIQQHDLPMMADPTRRVLGVIRPTAEYVALHSPSGHIGIVATAGTVASHSYDIEIAGLKPQFKTSSLACPIWVPLVENGEAETPGAQYFVNRDIQRLLAIDPDIDTIILGCTHYPLLYNAIRNAVPTHINVLKQGHIVADSLQDYLHRHPEMDCRLSRQAAMTFLTTGDVTQFSHQAALFLGTPLTAQKITLP